ncbi:carboxypeptidase regulatory-like domain-containing protein, partial [Spirochaetota bacterium]
DPSLTFSWNVPGNNTLAIRIQVAKAHDNGTADWSSPVLDQNLTGTPNSFSYTVPPSSGYSKYFARVKVEGPSGWDDWGDASDGISVAGIISGKVKETDGDDVVGADVVLYLMSDTGRTNPLYTVQTDSSGIFTFSNVPISMDDDQYRIVVTASGDRNAAKNNIYVGLGEVTNVGVIYIIPGSGTNPGGIQGTIVDANTGGLVGGAIISVRDWEGNEVNSTESSMSDGTFSTASVPAGTYTLVVTKTGFFELVVDNVAVTSNPKQMGRVALCGVLTEPQIRVTLQWGATPTLLDLHVVGPTLNADTGDASWDGDPTNRFHVFWWSINQGFPWFDPKDRRSYNEATGLYGISDPAGALSTTSLVIDYQSGYGPDTINLFRYGGASYAMGVYTFTVHDFSSGGEWNDYPVTLRIYDSLGLWREIAVPVNAPALSAWKAFKINIQGFTRSQRTIIVNSQDLFEDIPCSEDGSTCTKESFDW